MVALLLVVLVCLAVHQLLIQPLADGLFLPVLHGSWPLWGVLVGVLWLFAGPRRGR